MLEGCVTNAGNEADPIWGAAASNYPIQFLSVDSSSNFFGLCVTGRVEYCVTNGGGAESDPIWSAASNGYQVTGDYATGDPIYVESDPNAWTSIVFVSSSSNYHALVGRTIFYCDTNAPSVASGLDTSSVRMVSNLMSNQTGLAIGAGAIFSSVGIGIGNNANGSGSIAIGPNAKGAQESIAIGGSANSDLAGAAIGKNSLAIEYAVAIGGDAPKARGRADVCIGAYANSFGSAAAWNNSAIVIGYGAFAATNSISIGTCAGSDVATTGRNSGSTNVSIGAFAKCNTGINNATALGAHTSNDVSNSARVRGDLYLDGATQIVMRAIFGTGAWAGMTTDGTNLFFVNTTGAVEQITNL